MYRKRPNLSLGFHGCDESIRDSLVLKPNIVKSSQENYDWLGNGFYIWENNYERALKWALDKQKRGKLQKPSVVGVIYQLEYCLDFTDAAFIDTITEFYHRMKEDFLHLNKTLPKNKDLSNDTYRDLIIRELDCAVIQYLHEKIDAEIENDLSIKGFSNLQAFDTIRGIFTEGGPAFEGAGIQTRNHIQICIRNLNCIKGFFIPREKI